MLGIVNHHYIRTSYKSKYPSIFGITPDEFQKRLLGLANLGKFISQEELVDSIQNNNTNRNNWLITFDDGLKEQYLYVLPILEKLKIPAVFFFCTKSIQEKFVLNVHKNHLVRSLLPSSKIQLALDDYCKDNKIDFDKTQAQINGTNHYRYDNKETAYLKYSLSFVLDTIQQDEFVSDLFSKHFNEENVHEKLYMTNAEIQNLADKGMIGSHGIDHQPIGQLSEAKKRNQIFESKQFLEQTFNQEILGLSFPYGNEQACKDTEQLTEEAGYRYGLTTNRAVNIDLTTPYKLNRYDNNDVPGGKFYNGESSSFFSKKK